jgi:hypothetical protein
MSTNITQPTRQAIAARDRSGKGMVTGRLKRALDEMVWAGARRTDAATIAGMTDHSLRSALKKPHVKAYYLMELGVLRESTRAKVHHRLEALADQDEHKAAAVKACQILIADDPVYDNRRAGIVSSPGLIIQVLNIPAPPRDPAVTIDAQPEPAPASRQLFVPGRDEPIDEDETVFRSPWAQR